MTEKNFENLPPALQEKLNQCQELLRRLRRVVVAFSGGVDSTFLLALAVRALGAEHVTAAMGVSPSLPARQRREARELAQGIGAKLTEVETCEMKDDRFTANPPQRCFYCKSDLFTRLQSLCEGPPAATLISGANADDLGDFRPGLQAGTTLGVRNPLMEARLTKQDIRDASRAMGLATWDKPAMACLASRVPYGQPITKTKLSRIEQAEYALHDMGFLQCRVRDHDTVARIELPSTDFECALARRQQIVTEFKALGYTYVAMDLQGFRSGSMNETLPSGSAGGIQKPK